MSELADLTLAEASAMLGARQVSSGELTRACLDRIRRWQPSINAFLHLDEEGALAQARASDARRSSGDTPALDGIPVAHKDLFERAGRVMSAGSIILDRPSARTATVLRRLDAAGAVELGSLHTSEFAAGATGHSRHFGACRNPWDVSRTPGGSSGGSAAAVAARLLYASLGTDTGGSLRLPAHFCGVAALRPTYGRVSRFGVFPRSWSADAVGPIARTVEDLALVLEPVAGGDPADPTSSGSAVPRYAASLGEPISGVRIGVPRTFFYDRLDPGLGDLVAESLETFERLGARVVTIDVPDPARLFEDAQTIARVESLAIHDEWLASRAGDYDTGIADGMTGGRDVPAARYLAALRRRAPALRHWLDTVFAQVDLVCTPVYEHPTPTLDACDPGRAGAVSTIMATFGRCTRPFSYLGLPALALPCGFQADGLPAAFQLVARPFGEPVLLQAGHAYQRETAWHRGAGPQLAKATTPTAEAANPVTYALT